MLPDGVSFAVKGHMGFKTIIEPFRVKSVEPIRLTTTVERKEYLRAADYNPFRLDSRKVIIDLLTDSGTGAMSTNQWAGVMLGDEAYAGSPSWNRMEEVVGSVTGMKFILPTHQGRAAERILYTQLGGTGKIFISNTHFDTTRANIEYTGARAIDAVIQESFDDDSAYPFKGNMDVNKLESLVSSHGPEMIGAVILTVTNNSGGGQPVSMQNAREVSAICRTHEIPLVLDCCRVAENAYFIKLREKGYESSTCREIALEMFGLADAAIMSAKKDAMVNMGGFLALRDQSLADACTQVLIITEGFTTYGGLSGRDMEAIATGLEEGFDEHYLHYRIASTRFLADRLHTLGVPVMRPAGGHAVYVDGGAFYAHIPPARFPAQALVCDLYITGGVRTVEIGSVMFGKYDGEGRPVPAKRELVRLALPRRTYTQSHLEYVAEVFAEVKHQKQSATGLRIVEEPRFLRHFTARFERL